MTMEVLSPPAQLATPLAPPPLNERINPRLFNTQSPTSSPPPSTPASPSSNKVASTRLIKVSSPKDLAIGGFLPLPAIAASPICAMASAFPPLEEIPSSPVVVETTPAKINPTASKDTDKTRRASPNDSCLSLRVLFATPPTWISTPPTPPQKQIRRAVACDLRRPPSPVSPSASFPASTEPHAAVAIQKSRLTRCFSYPDMLPRSRAISEPALAFERPSFSHLSVRDGRGDQLRPSKIIFHLPNEIEDVRSSDEDSLDISLGCRGPDAPTTSTHNAKDALRIFHTLRELLMTEMDYVRDLRVLLVAYVQQLSFFEVRTSAFARASASFTAGPWINSYAAAQAAQSLAPHDGMVQSPSSTFTRPVFSDSEIKLLTRNLKDILQMHEAFIYGLENAMSPLGFLSSAGCYGPPGQELESLSSLGAVLKAVSENFIAEASGFEAYQGFCAGHPQAVDLIRRAMSQHPSDWESFEQRCLNLASMFDKSGDVAPMLEEPRSKEGIEQRGRTISMISPGNKSPGRSAKEADRASERQPRLAFMDYLIKPIQRICKYPLLLEQLKSREPLFDSNEIGSAVQNAIQAMRDVVASVDEARRKRDAVTNSSIIISRFVLLPSTSSLNLKSSLPIAPYTLTASFLSSLGTCLLAGSLDTIYYDPRRSLGNASSIKAKYLGAFLFPGGYLILAKISKGKKYEPRHWFSLNDFDVREGRADEAMLPYSFWLCSQDIRFELAAACQGEKDIWLQYIRDSVQHRATWTNGPPPSYKMFCRRGRLDDWSLDGSKSEIVGATPGGSDVELSESSLRMDSLRKRMTLKNDVSFLQDQPVSSSRRSSSTSVKSIFTPLGHDPNSILIHRSSISARLQVDQDLQDVASQACLSARLYASLHEELFQAPGQCRTRSSFSRSNSAISVAGMAKGRLSKQESIRVPRRGPRYDSMTLSKTGSEVPNLALSARRNGKRFSIQSLPHPPDAITSESTSPSSASSISMSNAQPSRSFVMSPIQASTNNSPFSRPASPASMELRSSRAILVRNVKDFFHIGSSQNIPQHTYSLDGNSGHDQSGSSPLLRRWKKDASRQRSHSAPHNEVPRTLK